MVMSSLRFLIGCPEASTALIDIAFFDMTLPFAEFGTAVLGCVSTVAAFEPVPRAFAGILSLNPEISVFVMRPPAVGVTVS